MMWEEQMRDHYNILNVKPDVMIYLQISKCDAYQSLRDDKSGQCSHPEVNYLTQNVLIDMPHHVVYVLDTMTPQDVAEKVYSIIREEKCAEGGGEKADGCELPCCEAIETE